MKIELKIPLWQPHANSAGTRNVGLILENSGRSGTPACTAATAEQQTPAPREQHQVTNNLAVSVLSDECPICWNGQVSGRMSDNMALAGVAGRMPTK